MLRGAAPSPVYPATTALWGVQLDDIVSGRTDFRAVIDGIAGMTEQLIEVLRAHPGNMVDLGLATAATSRGQRQRRAVRRPKKEPSAARAPRQRQSAKPADPIPPTTDNDL